MMRKTLFTMIAALATETLLTVTTSNAATYKFTFQSSDAALTATGEFTVNAADQVTGVFGAVAGLTNQSISGAFANPSFPNPSTSPDGLFIYDNLYSPTGMVFDYSGLLFTTAEKSGRLLESLGEFARRVFALRVGWRLLPDPGDRNSKRGRNARAVNLGDAGLGLCGAQLRWPTPSARGPPGARPRLKAA
jgi:hypothetical protein